MKCIYCGDNNSDNFNTKEHVIMKCFGTFGTETPTIDCVCDACNSFFSKELDLIFSRNSLEGITRYNNGIYSRKKSFQNKKYLTISIPKKKRFGEWQGALLSLDGTQNGGFNILPQVHFLNELGEYEPILEHELDSLDVKERKLSTKDMIIFSPSKQKYDELIGKLKDINIEYKEKTTFDGSIFEKYKNEKLLVDIQSLVDHRMKRAILKILFNFSAKFLGYEEVHKTEWDLSRKYIRYDEKPVKAKATTNAFWGEEIDDLRFPNNGYNIRVENIDKNVVGVIQFYNLYLYEFLLVENYNIDKEVCFRFTPGETPIKGEKRGVVEVNGKRIPIIN